MEPTPDDYVARMVEIFAEVRRVLRDDGTLWLNLGDSYNSYSGNRTSHGPISGDHRGHVDRPSGFGLLDKGIKNKDLIGIPWMVAFALRADGWYLRRDIIWSKPNPMPESVTDRPTSSHEYLFLLTKKPRYFYDADAIREAHTMRPQRRPVGRPADRTPRAGQPKQGWSMAAHDEVAVDGHPDGRNKRSVWSIPTHPFPDAHFATFPPKLVEPCILAGTGSKICPRCEAPWVRIVEREIDDSKPRARQNIHEPEVTRNGDGTNSRGSSTWGHHLTSRTVGWKPTCEHEEEGGIATALDPFAGAGTTGLVAVQQGRNFIGIELNPEYAEMGRERIRRWEANPSGDLKGDPEPIEGQIELEMG
jgi:DNA modification methylase